MTTLEALALARSFKDMDEFTIASELVRIEYQAGMDAIADFSNRLTEDKDDD